MNPTERVKGTSPLYVRIPLALRAKLEAAAVHKGGGWKRKGDISICVVEALTAGLEKISPVCGAQNGEDFCVLPRGHLDDPDDHKRLGKHSDGQREWSEPRARPERKRRRSRKS